jgi:hypothetical protein
MCPLSGDAFDWEARGFVPQCAEHRWRWLERDNLAASRRECYSNTAGARTKIKDGSARLQRSDSGQGAKFIARNSPAVSPVVDLCVAGKIDSLAH